MYKITIDPTTKRVTNIYDPEIFIEENLDYIDITQKDFELLTVNTCFSDWVFDNNEFVYSKQVTEVVTASNFQAPQFTIPKAIL